MGPAIALLLGILMSDIGRHALGSLGMTDIELFHPLDVTDMLLRRIPCDRLAASSSLPWAGIVSSFIRGLKQNDFEI